MQRRLRQAGMRPISLAVDVTNYVMLDLGQPLHAYDLAQVHAPIVVRRARAGESLTTLDDVTRTLHEQDLLITDSPEGSRASRPIGIAGVMGGASTEVTDATTDVLIEAAHFDPVTIARSARRHRLPSEASKRFERGVDPRLQAIAAQRVVDLLVEHGGARADDEAVTDVDETTSPTTITLDPAAARRLIGVRYTYDEVHDTLEALGAAVTDIADGEARELLVTPPTWRPDLTEAVDLIEEVVRLRGYDAVPTIAPRATPGAGLTTAQLLRRSAERTLAEAGLVQVLSYPFVGAGVHDSLGEAADDPRRTAERLANPLADDAPELRTSLLATLLPLATRNLSRGAATAAVYEVGSVTQGRDENGGAATGQPLLPDGGAHPGEETVAALLAAVPHQERHVAGVLAGGGAAPGGEGSAAQAETAIAIALRLAGALGVDVEVAAAEHAPFHPGRCAAVTLADGTLVGHAGELAPAVAKAFNLPARAAAFELDLDALVAAASARDLRVGKLSTFPIAKEDVALVVDAAVPAQTVRALVLEAAGDLAESVELFDVYTGDQVGEGKKSLAFALRLRAADRTLTAAETAGVRDAVVALAAERVGGVLRG
ncbi:phenylalanine--tRNA ligase subunit beta [Litorihabitans aurantiacus]